MWCEHCQTDVATEISADGQSLLCTTCGQPTRKVVAPSLHPETKSAREFLERWAREQQTQKQQRTSQQTNATGKDSPAISEKPATPAIPAAGLTSNSDLPVTASKPIAPSPLEIEQAPQRSSTESNSDAVIPPRKAKWRFDAEHGAPSGPVPSKRDQPRRSQRLEKIIQELRDNASQAAPALPETSAPVATQPEESPVNESASPRMRQHRIDDGTPAVVGPHFDPSVNVPRRMAFPGRSEAMWGQILAYTGVGLLTVGTVFVLWGYFGDIEQYASTGWLVATAGQMLLLLGIVTLVGGGMQQTTHEVSQRIEHLGGRIIRIEESTDKILKGPHFRKSRRRSAAPHTGEQEAA